MLNLKELSAAFDALDFSEENARIADLEAEIARTEATITKAEQRCTEISQSLIGYQRDAKAVADALVGDAPVIEAARAGPSEEDLREERTSLRAGIGDLNRRIADTTNEIRQIQLQALRTLPPFVKPIVDELIAEARAAAQTVVDRYVAIYALSDAAQGGAPDKSKIAKAVEGITASGGLASLTRADVPAELREALGKLAGKGRALPVRLTSTVPMP